MKLSDYQAEARRTTTINSEPLTLAVYALGLAGEAGEVADLLKKYVGHGHDLDRLKVQKELGDVLWYIAALATVLGIDLDQVAETNLAKLKARYPAGFSHEASRNRVDDPQSEALRRRPDQECK